MILGNMDILFEIKSESNEKLEAVLLRVLPNNFNRPYQSFEVVKEMQIGNIGSVIDLLNKYLSIIQKEGIK